MKSQIIAEIARLQKFLERAEVLADSESDTTANRYEQVIDSLGAAIEALEEIPPLWE